MRIIHATCAAAALLAISAVGGFAQTTQPYAGQERRAVKSLAEAEMADLIAGRGMGLAKAAELNGYPGPMHALEHAQALTLSAAQRDAIEAIRVRMAEAARALGREIVAREAELDGLFVGRRIDTALLSDKTAEVAALYGRLRHVHLSAHLETRPLLDAAQLAAYDRLRGYDTTAPEPHGGHHRRQH